MKKIVTIVGLVVLLFAALIGSILVGKGASQRFAKASTCAVQNARVSQLGSNSAIVTWETQDDSIGMVKYTASDPSSAENSAKSVSGVFTLTQSESASGKVHNVPLTLLLPEKDYWYLIAIGSNKCDSLGKACDENDLKNCTPWKFKTKPAGQPESTATPVASPSGALSVSPTKQATGSAVTSPTGAAGGKPALSAFCLKVQNNIGARSTDTVKWPTLKQYDMDNNGIINGGDVIACQDQGK